MFHLSFACLPVMSPLSPGCGFLDVVFQLPPDPDVVSQLSLRCLPDVVSWMWFPRCCLPVASRPRCGLPIVSRCGFAGVISEVPTRFLHLLSSCLLFASKKWSPRCQKWFPRCCFPLSPKFSGLVGSCTCLPDVVSQLS